MSAMHYFLRDQRARAIKEGVRIVREIIKSNTFPNGFTTTELFKLAVQQPPPPDFPAYRLPSGASTVKRTTSSKGVVKTTPQPWAPTHPEHPIRSIRFLKLEVLPILAGESEIKMASQPRAKPTDDDSVRVRKGRSAGIEFVWKVIDPNDPPPSRRKPQNKEVVGTEVGVGVDYQHLNKRRQNARPGKITQDVEAMKSTWPRGVQNVFGEAPTPMRPEPPLGRKEREARKYDWTEARD